MLTATAEQTMIKTQYTACMASQQLQLQFIGSPKYNTYNSLLYQHLSTIMHAFTEHIQQRHTTIAAKFAVSSRAEDASSLTFGPGSMPRQCLCHYNTCQDIEAAQTSIQCCTSDSPANIADG